MKCVICDGENATNMPICPTCQIECGKIFYVDSDTCPICGKTKCYHRYFNGRWLMWIQYSLEIELKLKLVEL